ncbi:hypothetical protein PanWU01x14_165940 [Parasponia andersonii]|uniref:Uncharacterized protein n=1 Tax=Parasponia andersonii TaxID=3476 RepID=A0A2P5CBX8_PARAD|nr:hypothetical protein PanWU01x14_165940 [Parasponia andersonii]
MLEFVSNSIIIINVLVIAVILMLEFVSNSIIIIIIILSFGFINVLVITVLLMLEFVSSSIFEQFLDSSLLLLLWLYFICYYSSSLSSIKRVNVSLSHFPCSFVGERRSTYFGSCSRHYSVTVILTSFFQFLKNFLAV